MDWEGGPKRGAFDETSWACALVLNWPTEKRKFLVGVPGQCGARKGGQRGGGSGAGGVGCSWSGAGRGGAGKGAGVGAGGLGGVGGWSRAEVLVGELPKTETRKFLVEQEGTGAGGGGVGLGGGLGGVGGGSQARTFWWDLVGMRVGSELPKTEKRKFLVGFLDRVE